MNRLFFLVTVSSFAAPAGAQVTRQKILDTAIAEIGAVKDTAGVDGFKIGWARLAEFYKVAFEHKKLPASDLASIQKVGERVKGAASWCGIFATWATKAAGVTGVKWGVTQSGWGPVGFGKSRTDFANLQPGDIVVFKGNAVHHALVESLTADSISTIDGNVDKQEIKRKTRKRSSLWYYYRQPLETGSRESDSAALPGLAAGNAFVNGNQVRFRAGASKRATTLALLDKCTAVTIIAENVSGDGLTWTKVDRRGQTGFVASQFISKGNVSACSK
ncbi:MAG: hypothetical protein HYY84_04185 [Deltaproteobacteria bacterium]|nr:hypothetical protein [Deltaproteobacteria bacterium]